VARHAARAEALARHDERRRVGARLRRDRPWEVAELHAPRRGGDAATVDALPLEAERARRAVYVAEAPRDGAGARLAVHVPAQVAAGVEVRALRRVVDVAAAHGAGAARLRGAAAPGVLARRLAGEPGGAVAVAVAIAGAAGAVEALV